MKKTVLIVDDIKIERLILKNILKEEFNIVEVANGEQALKILSKSFSSISLIVMDVIMPVLDGFETLKKIKSNEDWMQIPVIIVTVLNDEESREKAITYGADNFITKPFNSQLILHVIQNVIKLREAATLVDTLQRDKLTGVLNSESFFRETERMIKHKESGYYTLSCLNIENFKIINDQYGIEMGDKVICHISQTLIKFAGKSLCLIGRYYADKFMILFPTSLKNSKVVEETYVHMINPSCVSGSIRLRFGSYLVSDLNIPVSAMFDRACLAENSIKDRFDVFFAEYTESMRESMLNEQRLIADMVPALKNGEFEPWFQPQYNHSTGALIGAEALTRWRKDGKIIPPNDFIPVFERNGFIYETDKFIWRQVCINLRRWLDQGKNVLPISVNISRHDIFQKDFLDIICNLVTEYNLPVDLLRLEVTESAFSSSTKALVESVKKLVQFGFTIEIDDFGSGYSSLNTLKDVPASILKLDMKFFENTENSQRGGNIVESVIRMAKRLGMSVIAEGVENKAQADYLKTIGCDFIQGYFYSRPVPLDDYEIILRENKVEKKLAGLETIDTLNNNDFWDPHSMDTLIFSTYAGAACILEYSTEHIEMLRVNDYYVKVLGSEVMTTKEILALNWIKYMPQVAFTRFEMAVKLSNQSKENVFCEIELLNLPGCPHKTYMRLGLRVIATTGDRYLIYCLSDNMTAQRTAEKKEIETTDRLKAIMGNINGGVSAFTMDESGNTKMIFCNDNYFMIFGYTKEEAEESNLDVMACIIPEDFDMVVGKMNQLRKDGNPIIIDYHAVKRDKSLAFIRANMSIMHMKDSDEDVFISVEMDITENRTLHDQLSAIVNNIHGGISAVYLDENGSKNANTQAVLQQSPKFVFSSDRYFDLIGYTREQFDKEVTNILDVIHPDDRERIEKQFTEATLLEKQYTMEYKIIRRDGKIRNILCNTSIIHFFGIKELVQLAVSTDITELRQAEADKLEAMEQLFFLNEMAHDILSVPDVEFAINKTIDKLIQYFKADRSYIVEFDYDHHITNNTYERCDTGVKSTKEMLLNLSYDEDEDWYKVLSKNEYYFIENTDTDKTVEDDRREFLSKQNIQSLILAPLWRDGALIGFAGVDNPKKAVEQLSTLKALSDYIAVLLTRRDLMKYI